MKKVFLATDDPRLNSGLSTVGRAISERLVSKYDLTYIGLNSPSDFISLDFPYRVLPCPIQDYGKTSLPSFLKNESPEVLITIGDVDHFNYIPFVKTRETFLWLSFVTIDSVNYIQSLPNRFQPTLYDADNIITCSKFGKAAIERFLEIHVNYLPLGRNEKLNRLSFHEIVNIREKYGLARSFVILVVNRNSVRKQIPSSFKVMRILIDQLHSHEEFKEGVKIFIHTVANDPYGYNLKELIADYNIEEFVSYSKDFHSDTTNPSLTEDELCEIYNLASHGMGCFLTTSGGEGFGLTILDAMSCGVPVIGSNYSSIPEVVGDGGILVPPVTFLTTEDGTELAMYDPRIVSNQIFELVNNRKLRIELAEKAYRQSETFNWEESVNGLIDIIENTEKRRRNILQEIEEDIDVELIVAEGVDWTNADYAIKEVHTIPINEWTSMRLQEEINKCNSAWVAIISKNTAIQRGWLSELVKLAHHDIAVISSTCIDQKGKVVEGEVKFGNDVLFFVEEASAMSSYNEEVSTIIFSSILLNKQCFDSMNGFVTTLKNTHFDLEYCLRARANGWKIVKACKSIVVRTQPYYHDIADSKYFRQFVEILLNRETEIAYIGPRAKINTIHGDFIKDEIVRIPYRIALELAMNYTHIRFSLQHSTFTALKHAIGKSGTVMIVRNEGFGDVIAALLFAVRPIKLSNPDIKMIFVTKPAYVSFAEMMPFVDKVYSYPEGLAKAKDCDFFKDLCFLPESIDPYSERSRPEIFANFLGEYSNYKFDAIDIPEKFLRIAKREFNRMGVGKSGRKVIGIQATCASPIRVYAPEYLSDLVQLLVEYNYDVVLFGQDIHWRWGLEKWNGEHLFSFVNQVDDLRIVTAMMSHCDCFVAPDSGLMHNSALLGLPTIALFGNINPDNRIKYYPTVQALYPEGELECIPCGDIYNPCPQCSHLAERGIFSGLCMRQLYPERVLLKILEVTGENYKNIQELEPSDIVTCPICNSTELKIINEIMFWDNKEIPACKFMQCKNDGIIMCDPNVSPIEYEENYFQSGDPNKFYENILTERLDAYLNIANIVDDKFLELIN